jgi:hypothetical protein
MGYFLLFCALWLARHLIWAAVKYSSQMLWTTMAYLAQHCWKSVVRWSLSQFGKWLLRLATAYLTMRFYNWRRQ